MKTLTLAALAALASVPLPAFATQKSAKPKVEVAFVLDTTGSMGGLLQGAKDKIWSIANEIAKGQPTPDLKIGLVAYRDRGDAYVTEVFDLTSDIDQVYKDLSSFQADGGGDTPEDVNAAMHDAMTKLSWSKDGDTLKMVFLVGDAPPHDDYPDTIPAITSVKLARELHVVVDTIECGGAPDTKAVWQKLADAGKGRFHQIEQNGGVVVRTTPMDGELADLDAKLAGSVVAYGSADAKKAAKARATSVATMAAPAAAERADYFAGAGAASGRALDASDLVDAEKAGTVDLSKLSDDQLPDEMKGMNADQRKAYLERKAKERDELKSKIGELTKKRQEWLDANKTAVDKDSFDAQVLEDLQTQAKSKGLVIGG